MPDLLIELFSEEIPARMQAKAADDLRRRVTDGLVEAGLTYAHAGAFAGPRRLTLALEGVLAASPATREERKGPRVDAPEKALEGFLRSTGLTKDQLEARDDKKGQVWFAVIEKEGRPAADIVAEVLEETVRNFPWPKSMRWGDGSLRWVRPLHAILCILTDEAETQVVPVEIDGIRAGDTTRGHRFMAPEPFAVTGFDDYAARLKRARVMLSAEERQDAIRNEAQTLAFASGLEVVEDAGLLAEVAGLVEWPVVLMGEIGEEFLDLPPEVLQTSMKEHQKFFSVRDARRSGQIVRFITVANRETDDDGATILAGNQKVLAARLSDAKFFWENDQRIAAGARMQPWIDSLSDVTFHARLGSQADRVGRIAALARELAPTVGADADAAEQAAGIAKADLSSEMVGEFPELQGLMGRYYATTAGFPDDVAAACEDHYRPLGPSDAVPTAPVSVAVALADKLDTLAGFWAIDEKPTGSKDPFALRRAALGVIRLLLENGVRLSLTDSFNNVLGAHEMEQLAARGDGAEAATDAINIAERVGPKVADLLAFFHDRLKVYLRDRGIRHDVIDACLAMEGSDDLALLVKRAEALAGIRQTEDGENLIQGFKRANNILRQAEDGVVEYSFGAEPKFFETDAERTLFDALSGAEKTIAPRMQAEDFGGAMQAMAALRSPIDAFFETVQVNTDSDIIRRNRLNLLGQIRAVTGQVADLSRLEG
ncbi:glycine--tRNA ligase subunit beta [Tranquillimonas rosea]|uniref:glycine--tRNA ligase subunit beta n=1 Tax=Tranquillimonas rosea TaxID=641238 RepID=UPI003BA98F25